MQRQVVQRILGILLGGFSLTMLPPIGVTLLYPDESAVPFVLSVLITLACALALWYPVRDSRDDMHLRDGFLVVVLFWTVLGSFGALPFLLSASRSRSASPMRCSSPSPG